MTHAQTLVRTAPTPPTPPSPSEPTALLVLDLNDPAAAASRVYREVRNGRGVVAIACGAGRPVEALINALDAVGVPAVQADARGFLLESGVTVAQGPAHPPADLFGVRPGRVRVALAGCGVVGGGVLERLLKDPRFEVVGVLVRDPQRPRSPAIPEGLALSDPGALLAREPDVLIEALSDSSTALALMRAALARGVHVVSASKQAIASDPAGLESLARAHDALFLYSASVGGGAPLLETVRRARRSGPIARLEGVLNGTTNYVLNRLTQGVAFHDAVEAAQKAGFAEQDPSADLEGRDAAAKLSILAHAAGRLLRTATIRREPLAPSGAAVAHGTRQIARADFVTGSAAVSVEIAPPGSDFHDLGDEWSALRVVLADGRVFTAKGRGAGRTPTAESVWADLLDVLDHGAPAKPRSGT